MSSIGTSAAVTTSIMAANAANDSGSCGHLFTQAEAQFVVVIVMIAFVIAVISHVACKSKALDRVDRALGTLCVFIWSLVGIFLVALFGYVVAVAFGFWGE